MLVWEWMCLRVGVWACVCVCVGGGGGGEGVRLWLCVGERGTKVRKDTELIFNGCLTSLATDNEFDDSPSVSPGELSQHYSSLPPSQPVWLLLSSHILSSCLDGLGYVSCLIANVWIAWLLVMFTSHVLP